MPNTQEIVWNMRTGKEFAQDIEFNSLTHSGSDFSLSGKEVIIQIGDTVYRTDDADPKVTVPTPANGVAEFRLSDEGTSGFTLHQYRLKIDLENSTGYTTPYARGIVSIES